MGNVPQNCRCCTDYGMVAECRNCKGKETMKISELDSFWIDSRNVSDRIDEAMRHPAGSRWGNVGRRKDSDPVFRRRFYATLLVSFASEKLFARHKLYDSERRRMFSIFLERKDAYFKGCSSVEQYERELYRYIV
jgi:hypothetical protein